MCHRSDKRTARSASEQESLAAYWRERVRGLPDLRMDKVRATREALEHSSYDGETVLDATVERVGREIAILRQQASQQSLDD